VVFGLAIIDSVNPSALVVTIYLLVTRARVSRILVYLATVFTVYLSIGVALMLGLETLLGDRREILEGPVAHAVQGLIGAALLAFAILTPSSQSHVREARAPSSQNLGAMVLLGVTITVLEFPTALPYLAAIGIMTSAELSPAQWAPVLVIYNLIFVSPPLALAAVYRFLSSRLRERITEIQEWVQGHVAHAWLWIMGIVGFYLLADALLYFEFFGLFGSTGS
jgi:cytochrome c biogenesis protein CcdA